MGTTGLGFSGVTRVNAEQITVNFTGTATAGNVIIQAGTSAFNPVATEATNTLTITVPGGAVTVTGISVKKPPSKATYTAGDALDLTGLVVTLTKSEASSGGGFETLEDVAFAYFGAKGITTNPADGATLATTVTKVTLTHIASGKSVDQVITVNAAADPEITDISLAATSGLQVGNANVAANAEIGTLSATGGTATVTTNPATKAEGSATVTVEVEYIPATIDSTTGSFDKKAGAQADVTTTITWNSAASVTAVKKDETALTADTDYTVAGKNI